MSTYSKDIVTLKIQVSADIVAELENSAAEFHRGSKNQLAAEIIGTFLPLWAESEKAKVEMIRNWFAFLSQQRINPPSDQPR